MGLFQGTERDEREVMAVGWVAGREEGVRGEGGGGGGESKREGKGKK